MKIKLSSIIIFIALFFLVYEKINAQASDWLWGIPMGGTSYDGGESIASDASGNVYTTGWFQGTVDFDPGPGTFNLTAGGTTIFISKLDGSGNFVWAKAIGGTNGTSHAYTIADDASGNLYITGRFGGTVDFDPGPGTYNLTSNADPDVFISKLDGSGSFVWAKAMGGTMDDRGYSIATDSTGNVYTTGVFGQTVDFDPGAGTYNLTSVGGDDIFISKLDASGNFVWAKTMGGTDGDDGYFISIDSSGNVYSTGRFTGTVDFDPGSGTYILTSMGLYDIFISKLDASGNFVWAKVIGGANYDSGWSLALDASSNLYTTGFFAGTVDFDPGAGTFNLTSADYDIFISKLDSSGNFLWAKAMGGTSYDTGFSIAIDASGNVYTTGNFTATADFDPGLGTFNLTWAGGNGDIFVSKLDSSGSFVWAMAAGGTGDENSMCIAIDAFGNGYITGYFDSPFSTFGSTTVTNAGNNDIFIAKFGNITGIESMENTNGISVYPNPVTDFLNLSFALPASKNISLQLFNLYGQLLEYSFSKSQRFAKPGKQEITIDIKDLPQGIYFLDVIIDGERTVKKIVKE